MMHLKEPILYIVVPCFNEENVLPKTAPLLLNQLNKMIETGLINDISRILFVNDGSKDNTWDIIMRYSEIDSHYTGISLSRNRGHQNAVLAGLMETLELCDISISIDCDGQDDIRAMEEMIIKYSDGYEIVYGVRSKRETDTVFKKVTAEYYYRFLSKIGVDVIYNHADYRLMSKRVLQELAGFNEVNLYLRGLVPLLGFRSTIVEYERYERIAGESHYPLSKMLSLAFNGITSLSIKPLRMIIGFGITVALISFIGVIWAILEVFLGKPVAGWASMTSIVCFVSGVQLICMGIIGEYVGKIYLEAKHRPRYIICERTWEKSK